MSDQIHDFDDWFSLNYRRVLSSVLIVCAGDLVRAEDATNDAFIDALEKWSTVGVMDSPRSWVTKVAINKAKRSWLRRQRYVDPVNVDSAGAVALDQDPNVELWAAVNRLTVKQRSAIVLRYIDDLTQSDIATKLDIAPGTVSATLTQARAKLRVELEGEAV
ncbi:MAG: sigma-70 family RNA polymerase sigma factor [Acidimicrobiia bacterium]|nr:sigma-70 family RNA polymerase sigma factor [Acidimicrobiia bacterium]